MLDHSIELTPPTSDYITPDAGYSPDRFLDAITAHLRLKNDTALARALEVAPPVISKLRHQTLRICPSHLLRAHDATGISIAELKALAGLPAYVRQEASQ